MHKTETEEHTGFCDWQAKAIAMAATGNTRNHISEAVDRSLPNLRKFLRTPEAMRAVRDIRNERFDEVQSKLSADFAIVLERVQALLDSDDENVVLKAAAWLRQVMFDSRTLDIEGQLLELEAELKSLRPNR